MPKKSKTKACITEQSRLDLLRGETTTHNRGSVTGTAVLHSGPTQRPSESADIGRAVDDKAENATVAEGAESVKTTQDASPEVTSRNQLVKEFDGLTLMPSESGLSTEECGDQLNQTQKRRRDEAKMTGSGFSEEIVLGGDVFKKQQLITRSADVRVNQIAVGTESEIPLMVWRPKASLRKLLAYVKAPKSALKERCMLKKLPCGHVGMAYTPRKIGAHEVVVTRNGKAVLLSPFIVHVGDNQAGDASRVLVSGASIKDGKTMMVNEFTIDAKRAGYGYLSVSIEGPGKAKIWCCGAADGTIKAGYRPTEPGNYNVNVRFAEHHVIGSPFNLQVTGEGSIKKFSRSAQTIPTPPVRANCEVQFKFPESDPFDMTAQVTSPSGKTENVALTALPDSTYEATFVPTEIGVHTVSVKLRAVSQMQLTDDLLNDRVSDRVRAGELDQVLAQKDFDVCKLSIGVEGPSKAQISYEALSGVPCYAAYKVDHPGNAGTMERVNLHLLVNFLKDGATKRPEADFYMLVDMAFTITFPCREGFVMNSQHSLPRIEKKKSTEKALEPDFLLQLLWHDTWRDPKNRPSSIMDALCPKLIPLVVVEVKKWLTNQAKPLEELDKQLDEYVDNFLPNSPIPFLMYVAWESTNLKFGVATLIDNGEGEIAREGFSEWCSILDQHTFDESLDNIRATVFDILCQGDRLAPWLHV